MAAVAVLAALFFFDYPNGFVEFAAGPTTSDILRLLEQTLDLRL